MKPSVPFFLLLFASLAFANEALDVLEGKIDADSVILPPPLTEIDSEEEQEKDEDIIYLEPEWAASPPDIVWSRSILYDNAANPMVQQVAMMGFFDFQATFGESETDASGATPSSNTDLDGTRSRRARLGARIRAFNNTEIEAVGEFAGDSDYRGIERLKAYTQVTDSTGITYGKFKPFFGSESRTDEELSPYPHGAMLSNMVGPAPSMGVSFHHAGQKFDYDLGWFSSDYSPDLAEIKGDGFLNLGISRSFVSKDGDTVSRTRWNAEYIHNFDPGNTRISGYNVAGARSANGNQLIVQNPAYRHLFSTGFTIDSERHSFSSDFHLAKGETTVWGYSLGGTYWAIPGTLKLVGRYQYAGTNDARGIVTSLGNSGDLRYDQSPLFVGDEYHSFYLGANLHIYKDEFVLRNGVEYSIINDEVGNNFNTEAFTWHSGATLSF